MHAITNPPRITTRLHQLETKRWFLRRFLATIIAISHRSMLRARICCPERTTAADELGTGRQFQYLWVIDISYSTANKNEGRCQTSVLV
jgi:hypothetical protein